ncbi:22902_t:CDS:2 [Cetraspora pellucida]|uniref:22902_t:CDS:1 n=1 Tax=Cetraspora pellucida TaxID=1433469 RepID=A0A9N9NU60_9GLOM|nr:22902_t:CDS:2 [Cetraspora pellucida]
MNLLVAQTAPHFCKLSDKMLEDIKFYICSTEGIGATLQYNLLKAKYPNKYIEKKMYTMLFSSSGDHLVVIPKIEGKENRLTALFWMSSLQVLEQLNDATNSIIPKTIYSNTEPAIGAALQNLWPNAQHSHCIFYLNNNFIKKMKGIMNKDFNECYKHFCNFHNSLFEADFEHHWAWHHSWAVWYTQACFTASIQSTQHVKGINAIIKKEVSHNTTLLNLVDAIQNQLNEEAYYARINEQKNANPIMSLPHIASQYFPTIDSLIQTYLTPHILSLQRQQLSESFLYNITELFFDWDKNFSELKNTMEVGFLEDNYEQYQISLKSLLQTLRYKDILQIWVLYTNNVFTSALKKSISEKSYWSKGYRISKNALNLMIHLNCNDEFFQIMEGFIFSKACKLQLLEDEKNNCNNMVKSQQSVAANPYVTKHCGRPPKCYKSILENITSTYQNMQNTQSIADHNEQHERKRNKYANCRDYGHNVRTSTITIKWDHPIFWF